MKFGRTGLAVIGLFAVAAIGCPQPSHKTNSNGGEGGDGGDADTGGKTGTGGKPAADTGGKSGGDTGGAPGTGGAMTSTGGSQGNTGGSSTGGSMGMADAGSKADTGGGTGGMGGGGGGADMAAFMTLYDGLIKPKCGPACHITGNNGGLMMPNAMAAYTNLVNKPATQTMCKTMMRVKPGDPTMSVLSKKIAGTTCGTRMPAGTGKQPLTADEIKMIDDWIKGP